MKIQLEMLQMKLFVDNGVDVVQEEVLTEQGLLGTDSVIQKLTAGKSRKRRYNQSPRISFQ